MLQTNVSNFRVLRRLHEILLHLFSYVSHRAIAERLNFVHFLSIIIWLILIHIYFLKKFSQFCASILCRAIPLLS